MAALLALGGCSSQTTIWNQYFQVVREGWRNYSGSGRVTLEQAAQIPYATLAYRVDGGSEEMLILATSTNGNLLWTSVSRVVLMTRDGRVQRSVGLRHDRGGMSPENGSSSLPPPAQALRQPYRSVRLVDFPETGLHGVRVTCTTVARGTEMVTVLGSALLARRVDESCESNRPRWSFTDRYWVDADSGFVWQSLQHLHPSGPILHVKILRPPE